MAPPAILGHSCGGSPHKPVCASSSSLSCISSRRLQHRCPAAARGPHAQQHHHQGVVAAALLDAAPPAAGAARSRLQYSSQDNSSSSVDLGDMLDPAVWLEAEMAAAAVASAAAVAPRRSPAQPGADATAAAAAAGSSTLSGGSEAVIEILHMSPGRETATAAAARYAAGRASAQGADSTAGSSSSSKMGRRQRNRSGRPHYQQRQHLAKQYSNILGAYQVEYERWLHQQEEQFLSLLSSGASRGIIDTQMSRHDHMMRAWQQKWGPPISRDGNGRRPMRILQQAGGASGGSGAPAAHAVQRHQAEQEQEQQQALHVPQPAQAGDGASLAVTPVAAAEVAAPSTSHRRLSNKQLLQRPQQRNQQQHEQQQQQQQQQQQPKLAVARKAAASAASSSSSSSSGRAKSSAFSIPEPTPELLADAAAATEAAGRTQQRTNATVSSALVVQALAKEPLDRAALDGIELVFLHLTLPRLVEWRLLHLLQPLAEYILSRPDRNEHSCGAVFNAYALANRLDLALSTWDSLAAAGVDIGPFGSSALIKACARQMDLHTAKQVFEQLLRRRVTFNGYTYNCLLQLCGSAGSMEDALAVYNLQRLETERANLPNAHTYTALLRAMVVSGRCELTQQIFDNMLEDGVTPHPALYCTLLSAAGRSANLGLARHLYQHMAVSLNLPPAAAVETTGLIPAVLQQQQQEDDGQLQQLALEQQQQEQHAAAAAPDDSGGASSSSSSSSVADGDYAAPNMLALVNALLFAHAQVGALHGALAIYKQELLGRGLSPDAYTCTALLTAAARLASGSLSWAQVVQIVDATHHFHIRLTTQLGTSLINAYRRVRTWTPMQEAAFGDAGSLADNGSGGSSSVSGIVSGAGGRGSAAVTAAEAEHQQAQRAAAAAWEAQQLAAIGARALVGVPPVVAASLHAARQVLSALQEHSLATSNSYVMMLCFLLEQGQLGGFKQLWAEMTEQHGIFPTQHGWEKLSYAAADTGAGAMLEQLQARFEQQQPRAPKS